MGFLLEAGTWYACEIIGDEFEEDRCSYSPIKVKAITPLKTGRGRFRLDFYHANYPEGVRDKEYDLVMVERGGRFLLARSGSHAPARLLQIYDIDWQWMRRHCPRIGDEAEDIQQWLSRNV